MSKLLDIIGENALVSCVPIRRYELNGGTVEVLQITTVGIDNKTKFFTFDISTNKGVFDVETIEDVDNVHLLSKVVNITDGVSVPTLCTLEPCDCDFIMNAYKTMLQLIQHSKQTGAKNNDSISKNN